MKRASVLLLLLCYLASVAGFRVREHYCMGQFAGASIEHSAQHSGSHRCARCGMEKKRDGGNGCCKDKVKVLKWSPDVVPAKGIALLHSAPAGTLPQQLLLISTRAVSYRLKAAPALPPHGPPRIACVPVWLRVRSLRL